MDYCVQLRQKYATVCTIQGVFDFCVLQFAESYGATGSVSIAIFFHTFNILQIHMVLYVSVQYRTLYEWAITRWLRCTRYLVLLSVSFSRDIQVNSYLTKLWTTVALCPHEL